MVQYVRKNIKENYGKVSRQISVLGIKINPLTMRQAVAQVEEFIAGRRPRLIATANAEMVMFAQKDQELASILNNAALTVPDGAGVVWAARRTAYGSTTSTSRRLISPIT